MRVSIVVSILFVTALCSVEENLYGDAPIGNLTQALQREKRFFGLFGIGAALIGAKIVACLFLCNKGEKGGGGEGGGPMCYRGCSHGGSCIGPNQCRCVSRWSGLACATSATPTRANPCVNGRCVKPNTCLCDVGYKGDTCADPVCVPNCDRGRCSSPGVCECEENFSGRRCQTSTCNSDVPAPDHGTTVCARFTTIAFCQCPLACQSGFGVAAEVQITRCEKDEPIVLGLSDLRTTDPEIDVPCSELTDEQKTELASIIRDRVFNDAKGDGFDVQLEDFEVTINWPAPCKRRFAQATEKATAGASATVDVCDTKFLSSTALQGNQATVCVMAILKRAAINRVQRLLPHRLDSDVIGTGAPRKIYMFTTSALITARPPTLTPGICVFFVFLVFLLILVAAYVRRIRHCFSEREIACSSSTINKIRRFVVPTKYHHYLAVVAFVLANITPKLVSAQDTCYEDCGGFPWQCTSSYCHAFSFHLPRNFFPSNWSKAVENCSHVGGALASFHDKEEESAFPFSGGEYFFGLERRPTAATGVYSYRWSDGSFLTYAQWNQLSSFNEEKSCGKLVYNTDLTIHWRPESCSSQHAFICKKPKNTRLIDGDVRLVGSVLPSRGHLELFQDGFWRRVCVSEVINSAIQMATAACHQLGYSGLLEASSRVEKSDYASLDIKCTSNDEFVRSCDRRNATCNEHVFVSCRTTSVYPFDFRLVNSSVSTRGLLEILLGEEWKAACFIYFDERTPNLVSNAYCRHLGFSEGTGANQSLAGRSSCLQVHCFAPCRSFQDIRSLSLETDMKLYFGIEVTCRNSDWNTRLFNGFGEAKQSEGRVEVHINETWRVICDSKWNLNDSVIVCRQLGYGQPISSKRTFPATRNDVLIYTNGRRCKGNEAALYDCDLQIEQPYESCQEAVVLCEERKYCPRGWFLYAGYCYTLSYQPFAFDDHYWDYYEELCFLNRVSISSSHEHAFVLTLLADFESEGRRVDNDVWLGLQRKGENQFKWVNQDSLSYVMWARGEPSADPSRTCVAMNSRTGSWLTADCLSQKQMLCKVALVDFDNDLRETDEPDSNNRCLKDEIYFKEACYYLSKEEDEAVSHDFAHYNKCQERDSHLASFSSISEHFLVARESSPFSGSAYWIGLIYNDTSRAFTWLHGLPATFTMWAKYEPAHENGMCVTFGFDGVNFGWATAKCSTKAGYVCKRSLEAKCVPVTVPSQISVGNVHMCSSGWTKLGMQSCTKRLDTLMTWHESLAECENLSDGKGSLASINSLKEMDSLLALLDGKETWIGLNDIDNEGIYNWTDGSPVVYVNWSSSEREKSFQLREAHDCVAATKSFWHSRSCSERKKSVCLTPASDDFDECFSKTDNCHVNATCKNTLSSYKCTCKTGFIGNGTTCEGTSYQKESLRIEASCINNNGSFECICKDGFTGNGSYCEGNDRQGLSTSQLTTVVSVICFFVFFILLLAVFFFVRRRRNRFEETTIDDWDVNLGDLTLLERIGEGFFGVVVKAVLYRNPSNRLNMQCGVRRQSGDNEYKSVVACKMLKETYVQADAVDFVEEIKLMKRIGQHPHIVSMLACVTKCQPLCLIVEYCCCGDLLNYLRKGRPNSSNRVASEENGSLEEICEGSTKRNSEETKLCEGSVPSVSNDYGEITLFKHEDDESNEKKSETDCQACDDGQDTKKEENVVEDENSEKAKNEVIELTASNLLSFAWQIASGMEYLAGKGLVHRDLACRNVLVCENNLVKVSDFGLTRAVYEDGAYSQKTTRRLPFRWMSIEAILHRLFTEKSDVWSFGVVLWEIFTFGCFPYPCMSSKDILSLLRRGNRLDCPENCSREMYDLMSECWNAEPEKRPLFEQLSQLLGDIVEGESPNKYLNFDITFVNPLWDLKSTTGSGQPGTASSESVGESIEIDSSPIREALSDGFDVRYVIENESAV
ncbi:uncharacterized protein [Oscarella lobularis]|uniref:uncharacterized protein isoform X2 n=1 Tax=Oscarella lobularis TaxID=121494 RepID=UPI00331434B9